jgi:hypothetical protein
MVFHRQSANREATAKSLGGGESIGLNAQPASILPT